jgi:DNA polymerase/3'-5' exonuclease PolX
MSIEHDFGATDWCLRCGISRADALDEDTDECRADPEKVTAISHIVRGGPLRRAREFIEDAMAVVRPTSKKKILATMARRELARRELARRGIDPPDSA